MTKHQLEILGRMLEAFTETLKMHHENEQARWYHQHPPNEVNSFSYKATDIGFLVSRLSEDDEQSEEVQGGI